MFLSDTVSTIENTVTVYSYHSYSFPSRPSNARKDSPRYSVSLNNELSPFLNTNTKQAPYEKMGKLSSAKSPRQRDKQTQRERSRCLLSYPGRYWSHLLVLVGVTLNKGREIRVEEGGKQGGKEGNICCWMTGFYFLGAFLFVAKYIGKRRISRHEKFNEFLPPFIEIHEIQEGVEVLHVPNA
ncbi:hypothetical protein CDAR_286301 [Caerostris darwini]|uniref:Uncharacterized protein n=1 Tax=Caerostris darwini TaxID=1538125 RepID=A0AAV4W402_9ARAC|nr:hypothetical protein CDAR_286301 [Caerostris darwini]